MALTPDRVATKRWGTNEKVTRTLVSALLTSKLLYSYNYTRLQDPTDEDRDPEYREP